jgi:predicted nuclease with TOPRIM domain
LAEKLKKEFIELLEKDVEFRYTVAGYLGLSEILKRLDKHESHILEVLKRLDRLEENQEKLWEEVRALREEHRKLWEGQNKLWEGQSKLWEEYRRLRDYVKAGFRELGRVLGTTFEAHAASFLEVLLEELGYPDARVEKKYLVSDGEVVEINMFCERPLVVGEVTTHVATKDGARAEIEKLLKRVRLVEERYGRRVMLAILVVSTATPEAHEELRRLATEHGIRLVFGREIEERLAV